MIQPYPIIQSRRTEIPVVSEMMRSPPIPIAPFEVRDNDCGEEF